jgi:hypothetical protein
LLSAEDCKRILSKLGFQIGVSPKLIAERLLSKEDKEDMMNGLLSIETLDVAIRAWINASMPNYALGDTRPYINFKYSFKDKYARQSEVV